MLRQIKEKIAHKIPRLPRWGRRGIALLSVAFCIGFSGLTASATETYSFVFSKPDIPSSACYLECVSVNGWKFGLYVVGVQVLSNSTDNGNVNTKPSPALTYSARYEGDYLEIRCRDLPTGTNFYGYFINFDGSTFELDPSTNGRKLYIKNSGKLKYVHGYNCDTSPLNTSGDFIVSYGNDWNVNNKLTAINSTIESFKGQNQEQLNQILQAIISQGNSNTQQIKDNADKNANEIKKNQDDNSQKIIDNQNELQQKEKDETQQSGDKSTKDTQEAIPTVNEGFGSALKSFVASMSYNGTESKLPIPRAYLPAINGVTEEITLIPEQDYDMSQAINDYLPETLLQLIRHLFTIALILYCVYELYGLIQYVLTLKKGGKEE